MIHPFSNVITGLTQAGGVNNKGSLRDIQIVRNGQKIGTVDLYNYIFLGKNIGDVRLMDQDIIYIPPRISTIPLTGRVRNPGYYEVAEKESEPPAHDPMMSTTGRELVATETVRFKIDLGDAEVSRGGRVIAASDTLENILEELETDLLMADMGHEAVQDVMTTLRGSLIGARIARKADLS